jgi:hypothetical protein
LEIPAGAQKMKLKIVRNPSRSTEKSTEGRLYIDDVQACFTLEDRDRFLETAGCAAKVYGETCIARGNYQVKIDYSPHFGKDMPHILELDGSEVKCFSGIRIHSGNTDRDTEGCVLLGEVEGDNWIGNSQMAFNAFMPKLVAGLREGPVFLEII